MHSYFPGYSLYLYSLKLQTPTFIRSRQFCARPRWTLGNGIVENFARVPLWLIRKVGRSEFSRSPWIIHTWCWPVVDSPLAFDSFSFTSCIRRIRIVVDCRLFRTQSSGDENASDDRRDFVETFWQHLASGKLPLCRFERISERRSLMFFCTHVTVILLRHRCSIVAEIIGSFAYYPSCMFLLSASEFASIYLCVFVSWEALKMKCG